MTAAERTAEKREKRQEREIVLAAKQTALPEKRYGVILADPEWRFEPYSRDPRPEGARGPDLGVDVDPFEEFERLVRDD